MAKILVTEAVDPAGPDLLKAAGHDVVFADTDMDVIRREIVDADALFTRIIDLPEDLIASGKKLKVVSKHGVGYDNIPVELCKKLGIPVTLALNANSQSVAEHAFALMMTLAKYIIPVSGIYREESIKRAQKHMDDMEAAGKTGAAVSMNNSESFKLAKKHVPGMEVTGKTVTVVGLGNIGKRFAKMCAGGFGMKVLAYDPYVTEAPEGVTLVEDLDEAIRQADVVSLHCLLTPETRHLMNRERLALMKPTALLINCARGPVVDEAALIEALENDWIAGAGADVTDPEPAAPDSKLFTLPNMIVTPHFAPTTREAASAVSLIACQNILDIFAGKDPEGRLV
ncbi:MAG: hydroxyacid dehydrogenase [Oscillospiraceae bacterium]|nr:hydroxyacid dehydrogenase [Oscillospiraceae bacterium]